MRILHYLKSAVFVVLATTSLAFANDSTLSLKKPIRWAADLEAGAPYMYLNPNNPSEVLGFEKELIDHLSKVLNQPFQHIPTAWDGLIPGLLRETQYEVVANGIEITEERKKTVLFTQPYFITTNLLSIRESDAGRIKSLKDCAGLKIGTLKNAYSETYLRNLGNIDVLTYEHETNAYADLLQNRIDGVFLDEPITIYYGKPREGVKVLPDSYGQYSYGMALRLGSEPLTQKLNQGIQKLIHNGTLKKIYQSYGVWNSHMEVAFQSDRHTEDTKPVYFESFQSSRVRESGWMDRFKRLAPFSNLLLKGAYKTLEISVFSMFLAVLLGMCIALFRVYGSKPLQWFATAWVELLRGTPLILQLFLIYFGLPSLGLKLEPFAAAVLGLGLNYSAAEAENYRAGLMSVPNSQVEAATALGMSRFQTVKNIILPQAIRLVLPPMTNDFIALLKDSSIVSIITMVELMKIYGQISSMTYDYITPGLAVAAMYLLLGMPFVWLAKRVEKKFHRFARRDL